VWQIEIKFLFVRFSTRLQYQSYRASNFAHTKGAKKDCIWCVFYQVVAKCARLSRNITWNFRASKLMPACSLSSLYMGDSSFNHVPLHCVSCKTRQDASSNHHHAFPWQNRWCCVEVGNVRGNGIWMYPKISLSHESVLLDLSPSFSLDDTKSIFHHDHSFAISLLCNNYWFWILSFSGFTQPIWTRKVSRSMCSLRPFVFP
jgi:hypothetical protein